MINHCKISALKNNNQQSIENKAVELTSNADIIGIEALANNLFNDKHEFSLDNLKTLAYIGEQKPKLIEKYISQFIILIKVNNSELHYYALRAILTLAEFKPTEIYENSGYIIDLIEFGEEREADIGLQILSKIAAISGLFNLALFPYMVNFLRTSPVEVFAKYAEYILHAATTSNKEAFNGTLISATKIITGDDLKRIEVVLIDLAKV